MKTPGYTHAHEVPSLDLPSLPRDAKLRLLVAIAHDGLGRTLDIPVLVARGRRDGPVLGLTAAIHGNEINGIPVIHRLFDQLDTQIMRGTVVAAVAVNVSGVLSNQRTFSDGRDLNHMFPGRADGHVSEVWAHRVLDRIARHFNRLLDLHTASFGRANSLYVRADMSDPIAARTAYLQRPQIIVHNPPADMTLRGAAAALGIPAITVEIGDPQRFQPGFIKSTLVGVRRVMADMGMLPRRPVALGEPPILCARSYWIYSDHGGLLEVFPRVTEAVEAGDAIARVRDIFGVTVREYAAPEPGVVVGRSVNPVGETGARILHLGVVATPAEQAGLIGREALAELTAKGSLR